MQDVKVSVRFHGSADYFVPATGVVLVQQSCLVVRFAQMRLYCNSEVTSFNYKTSPTSCKHASRPKMRRLYPKRQRLSLLTDAESFRED